MASITINTTSAQDTRIIAAFRDLLGDDATGADVKAWMIDQLKGVVHSYETRIAAEDATSVIDKITPA